MRVSLADAAASWTRHELEAASAETASHTLAVCTTKAETRVMINNDKRSNNHDAEHVHILDYTCIQHSFVHS